ncbi:MAG: class I SAM-dependent methyltransferase [Magnetococcales bacterium]|nr:class I SAM-dependent methyltransferase [Magnetococcales bacterium]
MSNDYRKMTLEEVIASATRELVVCTYSFPEFAKNQNIQASVRSLLCKEGSKVMFVLLNPLSTYASACSKYHSQSSDFPCETNSDYVLTPFRGFFESLINLDGFDRKRLNVLMSSYTPEYRIIVVDNKRIYIYLHAYGKGFSVSADVVLCKDEPSPHGQTFQEVFESITRYFRYADLVPFIHNGYLFNRWHRFNLSKIDRWDDVERQRFLINKRFYDENCESYHIQWFEHMEQEVEAFLDEFPLNSRILVLGCGSGKEVKYFLDKKCDAYGLDLSLSLIDIGQREHPELRGKMMLGDMYDVDLMFSEQWDGVVANAVLFHLLKRDHIQDIFSKINSILKPGGMFFVRTLYKENADGDPVLHDTSPEPPNKKSRWRVYFSMEQLAETAQNSGFSLMEKVEQNIAESGAHNVSCVLQKGYNHFKYKELRWATRLFRKN